MQDFEMYDGEIKLGTVYVFWDNINNKLKNNIINTKKNSKYKIVSIDEYGSKYELEFLIKDIDDIYDIVYKYIKDNKDIFNEINKIKKYNYIKNIKKPTKIKVIIPSIYLKYFNKSTKDIDKNSIINNKIYFINKSCENNNLEDIKIELNKIIKYFNNIIKSNEYEFYDKDEKDKIANKAIDSLDKLISNIEMKSNYKFGKHFVRNLKIIM